MGRTEYGIKILMVDKLDKGFFPNLDLEDVPDGGFPDIRHTIYRMSQLRQFPGMDLVNAAQAGFVTGQGIHYINVNDGTRRIVVFGLPYTAQPVTQTVGQIGANDVEK